MMAQFQLQALEWHEDRRPMMRHTSEIRPTMSLASMDINTVLDVAGPKHRAKIEENHDVHGRIIAALLRVNVLQKFQS